MYTQIQTWIFRLISTFLAAIASIGIIFFTGPGSDASAQIFNTLTGTEDLEKLPFAKTCNIDYSINVEKDDSLWRAAERAQEETLTTLGELVKRQTGTGDKEGLDNMAEFLKEELEKIDGIDEKDEDVKMIEPEDKEPEVVGKIIVGTLQGTKKDGKKLLLLAHMDTVYERKNDGISLKQEDGKAIGPGVADDKSGIAVILHSLKLLRNPEPEENPQIPRLQDQDFGKITVLINTDEEKGSRGSSTLIEKLAKDSDLIFSYEPTQFLPKDVKEKLIEKLKSNPELIEKLKGNPELIEKLKLNPELNLSVDTEVMVEGLSGIKTLVAKVEGQAAHAGSNPEQGVNALVEASDFVIRTKDLDQGIGKLRFNWTVLKSGEVSNVIPNEATIKADIRYPSKEYLPELEKDLKKLVDETYLPKAKIS
ncbi:MAG: M20/M25/M40 family metallo-hydrolase, partial [Rhizonema sp. PD38]|nr:M20/M25/M40 family metallo-hydrolase [Rhizonema sp. PD38]